MITVEDKIRTFSKYVYEKEVNISQKRLQDSEEKNTNLFQQSKKEIDDKKSALEEKMKNKTNLDSQKIISVAKMKAKNKLLETRNNILDSFLHEIEESIRNTIDSSEYNEYMGDLINANRDYIINGAVKVSLIDKDMERFGDKLKQLNSNIKIVSMPSENLGGIIIENPSTKQRIDMSLLSKINSMKNEIGIRLYEALEK